MTTRRFLSARIHARLVLAVVVVVLVVPGVVAADSGGGGGGGRGVGVVAAAAVVVAVVAVWRWYELHRYYFAVALCGFRTIHASKLDGYSCDTIGQQKGVSVLFGRSRPLCHALYPHIYTTVECRGTPFFRYTARSSAT